MAAATGKRVLISGGGIAGLTLGILLREKGFEPVVIERDPAPRAEGYMMDFFGSGWDVAERMGLVDELRAIRYPIDAIEYVDAEGQVLFSMPIQRVKNALDGRYVYIRRSDLERILLGRVRARDVEVRFGRSIAALEDRESEVQVTFDDGRTEEFALVFGADGVHSCVRELLFGPEEQFSRYLRLYVAAFHIPDHGYRLGRALKIYEEPNRLEMFYPLDERRVDATYVFRFEDIGHVPPEKRLALLKEQYKGAGFLGERLLRDYPDTEPIYFDAQKQIVLPNWQRGRMALLGDACGCLTLLAGQGSHMAMAGAYVIAHELERYDGDHRAAFAAYESLLKPVIAEKQKSAARFSGSFVPSPRTNMTMRHLFVRLMFSAPLIKSTFRFFGSKSVLTGYG